MPPVSLWDRLRFLLKCLVSIIIDLLFLAAWAGITSWVNHRFLARTPLDWVDSVVVWIVRVVFALSIGAVVVTYVLIDVISAVKEFRGKVD